MVEFEYCLSLGILGSVIGLSRLKHRKKVSQSNFIIFSFRFKLTHQSQSNHRRAAHDAMK